MNFPQPSAAPEAGTVSRVRALSWKKRIAFSFVMLLLCWGLLELCAAFLLGSFEGKARIILDRVNLVAVRGESRETEAIHPYYGWCLDPRTDRVEFLGKTNLVNELGFVDDTPTVKTRSAGTVLVGICGGSVAQQVSFGGRTILTERLREHPRFAGRKVEFVSLAMAGFKQPQQLMALNYVLALGGELDLLINIDGYNEIALPGIENFYSGVNYAYPRLWHIRTLEAVSPQSHGDALALLNARGERQNAARRYLASPFGFSCIRLLLWNIADQRIMARLANLEMRIRKDREAEGRGMTRDGPRNTAKNLEELQEQAINLWTQSSVQLARLCAANGIQYVHVLQPNQYLPGSKPMGAKELKDAYLEGQDYGRMVARYYPTMIRIGESFLEQGVNFLDATGLFARVEAPIYCDPYCHYNEEGVQRLADAIGDHILKTIPAERGKP